MKTYIMYFTTTNFKKIQLIKMILHITNLGLRDAKEFVETQIIPKIVTGFSLHVTEIQLGRYFTRVQGESFAGDFLLQEIKPVLVPGTDLTKL
jgi:hypothetical protein